MIFDLHNDLLVKNIKINKKIDYLVQNSFNEHLKYLILPLFTEKGGLDTKRLLELENLKTKQNKVELFLAFENLCFLNEENIENLIKLKPIYCSLTWNFSNNLAGGVLSDNGITNLGFKVIKILNDNDIFIDTAHLNQKSFFKLASCTDKPIINTHTGFSNFNEHFRNITDEQIKIIIESGGIIGFTFVAYFTKNKKCSVTDIANHIDFFIQKYGHKNLAIGTDFFGTKNLPKELKCYIDFDNLCNELFKKGYKKQEIDDIFCDNAKRFFNV